MPQTKHKLFKAKISDDGKLTISKSIEDTLNKFLDEPNIVYVNHSITILTEDIEEYDNLRTVCKYILISLVYKDLDSTSFSVKSTSKEIRNVVHKEIESGEAINEPDIQTGIDKEIVELERKAEKQNTPANNV